MQSQKTITNRDTDDQLLFQIWMRFLGAIMEHPRPEQYILLIRSCYCVVWKYGKGVLYVKAIISQTVVARWDLTELRKSRFLFDTFRLCQNCQMLGNKEAWSLSITGIGLSTGMAERSGQKEKPTRARPSTSHFHKKHRYSEHCFW